MDRTTIRVILLIIGVMVIAGVYLWHEHHEKILAWWGGLLRKREYPDDYADEGDASFSDYLDEFNASPLNSADPGMRPLAAHIGKKAERKVTPTVVQLNVVAAENEYFSGTALMDAFSHAGLRYGDMGIFHHYDEDHNILFSVASIVEPGTFPINNMANFMCPGVVLFFQTSQVMEPLEVFDNLVSCCHELAIRLDGVEWGADHQPLSTEKIVALRSCLS